MPQVIHNRDEGRFQLSLQGLVVYADYRLQGNQMVMHHTFVPEALRGQGLAAQVVAAATAWGVQAGYVIVPTCSYVQAYLQRHPL